MEFPSVPREFASKEGVFLVSVFAWLGVLLFSGSLAVAYLDSIGYWNYPKDFIRALFADRGSEPVGMGVQGLQLFHYSVGGIAVSAACVGLLGSKGKLSEIFAVKRRMSGILDHASLGAIVRKGEKEQAQISYPVLSEAIWSEITDTAISRALLALKEEHELVIERAHTLLHG